MNELNKIEIILPIVPYYSYFADYINLNIQLKKSLIELDELNDILFLDISENIKLKIEIKVKNNHKMYLYSFQSTTFAILFSINFPTDFTYFEFLNNQDPNAMIFNKNEKKSLFMDIMVDIVEKKIYQLLLILNIAKPGVIHSHKGKIKINNKNYKTFCSINSLHRECTNLNKTYTIPFCSYLEIYKWFLKKNFHFDKISNNRVERALNNFSKLYGKMIDDDIVLIYAIIGLEALFCNQKKYKTNQLYNNINLLLGTNFFSKKQIQILYKTRSNLVHGNLEIAPNKYDGDDIDLKDVLFNSALKSLVLLTLSLQKLIKNEINTIKLNDDNN